MGYLYLLRSAQYLYPRAFLLLVPLALVLIFSFLKLRRRPLVLCLRALSASLLILALANPIKVSKEDREEVAALIDISESMPEAASMAQLRKLQSYLGPNSKARLIAFAGSPAKEIVEFGAKDDLKEIYQRLSRNAAELIPASSNIQAAVLAALARTSSANIFLLSDGFETNGNALRAAEIARSKGARLYPLLADPELFTNKRLSISSLYAPLTAQAGESVEIRSAVLNTLPRDSSATVELWLGTEKLLSQNINVPKGQERLVKVSAPLSKGGLEKIRVLLKTAEGETSERYRYVAVKEKSKLLLLSGGREDERILRQLISQRGYKLDSIVADGSREIPRSFEDVSAVIMNNISRNQLPTGFLNALETFTDQGGGVLLVGGNRSYGLGGYIDSPLESISPLKFLPPQTEKKRVNNYVELVIDKSGSMKDEGKIFAAKQAAMSAILSLKDEDYVGVIGFDAAPFEVIALSPVRQIKAEAEYRLRNLTALGKTDLLPALSMARQRLLSYAQGRKHIIVLSDGKFPILIEGFNSELTQLRSSGISLSAIALGMDVDVPFMKLLAKSGKGAFYHTLDASQLPRIFVEDIKVATGEKTMSEGYEIPLRLGPSGLRSTKVSSYPPLLGVVETLAKREANLELVGLKGETTVPILASWVYGAGKVIAFASDANGRWSGRWLGWDEFSTFWGELLEKLKGSSGDKTKDIDFDLRYSVEKDNISLDLAIYDEKLNTSAPKISAQIIQAAGELKTVTFSPKTKGRFSATLNGAKAGDYRVEINYGNTRLPPLGFNLEGELFGELRGKGLNLSLLESLAQKSWGELNPSAIKTDSRVIESQESLFLPLLMLGFLLILLEALYREIFP